MKKGQSATLDFTVGHGDTAVSIGSGDLAVLGTPRLLAWCEGATVSAIASSVREDQTSLGTRIALEHLAASPVGERLSVRATVTHVDGRLVRFEVVGTHSADDKVIGRGEITRIVIDRERFLARLASGPS
ncbi:MAG TPA: hotdog domain-containing protein [Nocardioidaceae bacterium]|nr:hotdog domain-containing protein [Nocardioidaceae bacterium]